MDSLTGTDVVCREEPGNGPSSRWIVVVVMNQVFSVCAIQATDHTRFALLTNRPCHRHPTDQLSGRVYFELKESLHCLWF
jgi:hypothetical protein